VRRSVCCPRAAGVDSSPSMRKAWPRQELRPSYPEDTKPRPPPDFCNNFPWPKAAPGPPPISNPVKASDKVTLRAGNTCGIPKSGGNESILGSAGANRNATPGHLLIKFAADKQQGELTMLIKQGQDPNVKLKVPWQEFETTPLFEAAINGYKRIVRVLIEAGAKVDEPVGPGFTPLYNAALNGHDEAVRLLVDAGARVDVYTESGLSPLYVAAQGGHGDSLVDILGSKRMTRTIADYAGNGNGATALYIATQNGEFACVRELVQAGVSLDPQMESCGSTPLMCPTFIAQRDDDKPHRDILELLLQSGANIEVKNKAGLSAIDLAKDDNSIIKLINDEKDRRKKGGGSFLN